MAIAKSVLEDLEKRRAAARAGGGLDKQEARRKKGIMTARERLEALYQPGTFQEWGMHANHDCHNFGLEGKSMPGDGVVTGTGIVDGRVVAAFSQDFTVRRRGPGPHSLEEDLRFDGLCAEGRLPHGGDQRLRWSAHPGG